MELSKQLLSQEFDIDLKVLDTVKAAENQVKDYFSRLDDITAYNQYKVLAAFQKNRISDRHFAWNTGYGYDDPGREAIEKVFSDTFHTEASLVRTQIVNGTHALSITLLGILRPGEKLIYCSGGPYDTLEEVIGIRGENMGSLKDYGIDYDQVELLPNGKIDVDKVLQSITPDTKVVAVQRATGYGWRKSITIEDIKIWAKAVHEKFPDVVTMVDNCYGEFLDIKEPTDVGVDVMAGSLIKNPGGGLALSGGYVTGKQELIDKIAYRLTCPGIGGECGLTFGQTRQMLQGFFMAPKVVNGAVKGAILCGQVYKNLGFEVCPEPDDLRSDIIQAVKLNSEKALVAFCQGIQSASPIDSYVKPMPWDMPGYDSKVVMAAGAFVQGSSIELSADGPARPPYNVYFQGGLTYEASKIGIIKSLDKLYKEGIVNL